MRFGLILSIALHAAVILIATLTIVRMRPIPLPQDDIPVDVVTIDQQTNVKAEAPKVEKPEEKPAPAPEPAPTPPQMAPEPPSNEAVLTPQEKPEPKKPEPPKPQEKPKPPQEEKPKDEHLNLDSLQAKLKDLSKKDQKKQQKTAETPAPGNGEPRAPVNEGTANTADINTFLINSMKRQVTKCWNFPAGAVQPEELIVWIDIQLRPDGNLSGPPVIEEEGRMGEPYFRAAAEAAVRALNRCQPYELPADSYDTWKDMRLYFDPRKMLGQ